MKAQVLRVCTIIVAFRVVTSAMHSTAGCSVGYIECEQNAPFYTNIPFHRHASCRDAEKEHDCDLSSVILISSGLAKEVLFIRLTRCSSMPSRRPFSAHPHLQVCDRQMRNNVEYTRPQ